LHAPINPPQERDRHEHHLGVADVVEVVHLELAAPTGFVAGLAAGLSIILKAMAILRFRAYVG